MKRFLVVGCGGSGGVTLQFLMDQLRADLAAVNIDALPGGWQFVHVDVPASADGVGAGLPPTVRTQGGRYVSVHTPGATYAEIGRVVERSLAERRCLGELARWRPPPSRVNVPVDRGAGQYRAVGRILTLSKMQSVRRALEQGFADLQSATAKQQLRAVAEKVSPATAGQVENDAPVVIVISSMAGGSGASMALDVCRLLTSIASMPQDALLFAYTAEVFHRLEESKRAGVEANAAAMMGELLATQIGAAAAVDRPMLAARGIDVPRDAIVPFRRVVPIGAKVGGDGAVFGDGTQTGVYRGVGRGLAALMLSGVAMGEYQKAVAENGLGTQVSQPALAWGVDSDALLWGSFGFASVGLGRDRYAEYAAQRLGRQAVDRLVAGHLRPGDNGTADEQMRRLVEQEWPQVAGMIGVPVSGSFVRDWVLGLFSQLGADRAAAELVAETIGRRIEGVGEQEVRQWTSVVTGAAVDYRGELQRRVDEIAYAHAFEWQRRSRAGVLAAAEDIISRYGLAAARRLLEQFASAAEDWIAMLRSAAAGRPADLAAASPDVVARIDSQRGRVSASAGQVGELLDGHGATISRAIQARFADLLAELLPSMVVGYVRPLAEACSEQLAQLERARVARVTEQGQAHLRTSEYPAWPSGVGRVPPRFSEAQNEVLLTRADDFEVEFGRHLSESVPGQAVADALAGIVTTVLRGHWTTTGAGQASFPTIQPVNEWWPRVLRRDLDRPDARSRAEVGGQYRLLLSPAQVLERARAFVARRNEAFDRFVSQSLLQFLTDETAPPTVLADRAGQLQRAFARALDLSRPLVALNRSSLRQVHGMQLQTYHTFSGISFGDLDVARQLRDSLDDPELHEATVDSFDKAERDGHGSATSRIDIFGGYPCFSPAVCTSLLEPVAQRWSSASDAARASFWQWRRTRRLPGAVPAGDVERQAMIGGYFLGRLLGLVRFPGESHNRAIEVYELGGVRAPGAVAIGQATTLGTPEPDALSAGGLGGSALRAGAKGSGRWLAFPEALLTPLEPARHALDKVASLLESVTMALAACYNDADLTPLRPFAALRAVYDDGAEPASSPGQTSAARLIGDWVLTGRPPGPQPPIADLVGTGHDSPERRKELMCESLERWRRLVGVQFLPPGVDGAAGGGDWSEITAEVDLSDVPLFHEIAADAHLVLRRLEQLARAAPTTTPDAISELRGL